MRLLEKILKKIFGLIDLLEDIDKIEGIERIRLRFARTKTNNRGICRKIKKTKKNMLPLSFITAKWSKSYIRKDE